MYLTISSEQNLANLAMLVIYREQEVYGYQVNIDNYTTILSALPSGDVPEDVAMYMSTKTEELPSSISDVLFKQISDYKYREYLSNLLKTEKVEQNKSMHILNALKAQIPADQLDALVAEALAKINAQTPAA